MRILIGLTYYRPHVSGLTIYVERLAKALVRRGHQVTILTAQYDRKLAGEEMIEGVRVKRVPVLLRVSKGVIMPTLGIEATRAVRDHDVISLHLPQFDAAGIALRGRWQHKPTVLTYHCDLRLPDGVFNRIVNRTILFMNGLAGNFADAIVAYTRDYATHSPFISRYMPKVRVILPPVEVADVSEEQIQAFKDQYQLHEGPIIGMAARLATEKGVEYLLQSMELLLQKYPQARVLFAGQYEDVMGEAQYANSLQPLLKKYADNWIFLGVLDPIAMSVFYRSCDVTVLPSVNSTESFGLVQIESMICGAPVVASDLPGVRQPVYMTGMGKVVPLRDWKKLAGALLEILADKADFLQDSQQIAAQFSSDHTAVAYETLFEELMEEKNATR